MSDAVTFQKVQDIFSRREQQLARVRQARQEKASAEEELREAERSLRNTESACVNLLRAGALDVVMEELSKSQAAPCHKPEDAPRLAYCKPGTLVVAGDGTVWERVEHSWLRLVRAVDFREDVNDQVSTVGLVAEKETLVLREPAYTYMAATTGSQIEGQTSGEVVHSIGQGVLIKDESCGYRNPEGTVYICEDALSQRAQAYRGTLMLVFPAEAIGVKEE